MVRVNVRGGGSRVPRSVDGRLKPELSDSPGDLRRGFRADRLSAPEQEPCGRFLSAGNFRTDEEEMPRERG